jgi:hypothetical protein
MFFLNISVRDYNFKIPIIKILFLKKKKPLSEATMAGRHCNNQIIR